MKSSFFISQYDLHTMSDRQNLTDLSKHLGNPLGNPGNPLPSTGRSEPLI